MTHSGFCGERGYSAGAGPGERTRDKTSSGNVCRGSWGQTWIYHDHAVGGNGRGGFDNSLDISQIEREAAEGQEVN